MVCKIEYCYLRHVLNEEMIFSMQVWVLDATPGKVRSGGDGEDHPGELIATLREMPSSVTHS